MTFALQTAAAAAAPPTVLPLPRRVARDVLLAAAARAAGLAARLEKADLPARTFTQTRGVVRWVETAVLFAVAVYFTTGVVAVLVW